MSDTSTQQISCPSYSKSSSIWSQECCSSNLSCDIMEPFTSADSSPITFERYQKHIKNKSSAKTINAIMQRRPSVLNLVNERQIFGRGLEMLEPRPLIYWGSMEETMSLIWNVFKISLGRESKLPLMTIQSFTFSFMELSAFTNAFGFKKTNRKCLGKLRLTKKMNMKL